ncbi:hypothetical protein BC628DRAFT_143792 [Trametes gibbosa]|nr:hypothetical protein BC628DRAFT_143792 [Trametes gibbosa]
MYKAFRPGAVRRAKPLPPPPPPLRRVACCLVSGMTQHVRILSVIDRYREHRRGRRRACARTPHHVLPRFSPSSRVRACVRSEPVRSFCALLSHARVLFICRQTPSDSPPALRALEFSRARFPVVVGAIVAACMWCTRRRRCRCCRRRQQQQQRVRVRGVFFPSRALRARRVLDFLSSLHHQCPVCFPECEGVRPAMRVFQISDSH